MSKNRLDLVMIGPFPPPMHGMAAVNAEVKKRIAESGTSLQVINTAALTLDRRLGQRLRRVPRIIRGIFFLISTRDARETNIYVSVSGGLGQIYELIFLMIAKLKAMSVVLHHHSFKYISRRSLLTSFLVSTAGPRAIHVLLSKRMLLQFRMLYPRAVNCMVISNAGFLLNDILSDSPKRKHLGSIGFLGNISAEKGVLTFLDICAAAKNEGLSLKGRLAGPFQGEEIERQVYHQLASLPMVEYLGPQYGEAKTMFYRSIDVLLFPSNYANEAEPLVILEAIQQGLPVIAYDRGAISELIDDSCGCLVKPNEKFVNKALRTLQQWYDDPDSFEKASIKALNRFRSIQGESQNSWKILKQFLLSADRGPADGCLPETDCRKGGRAKSAEEVIH